MNKILAGAMALALGAIPAAAQSFGDQNIQIHGFATQAFVVSSYNNYLGMDSQNRSSLVD